MHNYGEFIKQMREEKGLSQLALAKKINTSSQNINRWERGEVIPSIDFCIELAKFFNCSLDFLAGLTDEEGRAVPQELSEREKKILKLFGSLTELEQDKLIADAEFYAGRHSSGITPKRIG